MSGRAIRDVVRSYYEEVVSTGDVDRGAANLLEPLLRVGAIRVVGHADAPWPWTSRRRRAAVAHSTHVLEPHMTPVLPRLRLLVALVPLLAACASHQPNLGQSPPSELTGHVTTLGQGYWFRPCTAPADSLWVTFTGRAVAQRDDAQRRGAFGIGQPTYVRWMAARAKPGQVGPGGPALLVQDISEARTAATDDCRP